MCSGKSLAWIVAAITCLLIAGEAMSQTFVSATTGSWSDGGTWGNNSPGQKGQDYPANNDNVIISTGTVVTHLSKQRPTRVVIESGGELVSSDRITIRGTYINNGIHSGIGLIELTNQSDSIAGTGEVITSGTFSVRFQRTIVAGSDLTRSGGVMTIPDLDTLFVQGTLTLNASNIDGLATSVLVNESGGVIDFGGQAMLTGSLVVNAPNNTVIYSQESPAPQTIKKSLGGYFNLSIDGLNLTDEKVMTLVDTILNDLKINNTTLILQDTNLLVGGSITLADSNAALDVLTNQSTITLNGTGFQSINGAFDLYDLRIEKLIGSVDFFSDTTRIHHGLYVNGGSVSTNGNLLLVSNLNGDAFVAPVQGSISGDVTAQRYIGAGATGWRFMCSPVSGATLADWNDDFITSGFPGSDFPSFYFTSIMAYDETDTGHQDSGFVFPSGVGQSIPVTGGYWVWCGDFLAGTSAFTVDVTGPLNTGPIVYPITYSNNTSATADGWNLVSNPYASVIDWDSPSWTKLNVDNGVYVWNTNSNSYASYVGGVGVNGGSNLIASGQAFYVKANTLLPVLSINESCKSTDATAFLRPGRTEEPILRLTLKGDSVERETVIRLTNQARRGFDEAFDSYHLAFDYDQEQLYTTSEDVDLAINSFPFSASDSVVLSVREPDDKFELHFEKNDALSVICVALRDRSSGAITILNGLSGTVELNHQPYTTSKYDLILQDPFYNESTHCRMLDASEENAVLSQVTIRNNKIVVHGHQGKTYRLMDLTGRVLESGIFMKEYSELEVRSASAFYLLSIEGSHEAIKLVHTGI